METNPWKDFFSRWPAEMQRHGILVTAFNEQIPFSGFWLGEQFLLLERQMPDSLGSRSLVFSFEQIVALKITDVLKPKQLKAVGFETGTVKT